MQPDELIQLRIFQADIIICRIADMMRVMAGPLAYPGNANAHGWRVTVYNNGLPANLSGNTITAYFKRSDGNTVLVQGTANGNVAQVVFPAEVYAVPGVVHGIINATVSGQSTTALDAMSFTVRPNLTGNIIDPGSVIPASIDDLLAMISEMRDATDAAEAAATKAVRYDSSQGLTDAQKSQARSNIGLSFADSGDGNITIS